MWAAVLVALALGAPEAEWLPGPPKALGASTLVDICEDGRVGVLVSDSTLVAWDIESGKRLLSVRLPGSRWHTLSVAPRTAGEVERVFVASDRRAILVHLRTGRLIADWPVPSAHGNVERAVSWAADGARVALMGWELPGLIAGAGAPVLWVDAEMGTVVSQLRLPEIYEGVRDLTTMSAGRLAIGTPRRIVVLGPGVSDAYTIDVDNSGIVGATRDGIVVMRRGALVIVAPSGGKPKELARMRVPVELSEVRMWPGGRWALATGRGAVIAIDLARSKVVMLSAKALKAGVARPTLDGLVALGKKVVRVSLVVGAPDELLLESLCVRGDCDNGEGSFVDLVAKRTYTGTFKGGEPSGKGMLEYEDGAIYSGPFVRGRPHGDGRFVTAVGDERRVRAVEGELRSAP